MTTRALFCPSAIILICALTCNALASEVMTPGTSPAESGIRKVLDIAPVWSGHPVGFALLTHKDRQYVAFYDADRRMTVASRPLDSDQWEFVRLPEQLGWDSHNYITMIFDSLGYLHLSGNMHCNPLVYFRSTKPYEISTLERVPSMVGRDEHRCTYPHFIGGFNEKLIFAYRNGASGDGEHLFNVYDEQRQQWRRLLDQPLLSGEGDMNAYYVGPVRDRKGIFHLCWVWRDTPDCATNHDLSYARSTDLVHWETGTGTPLTLPITLRKDCIVDPVPVRGGMINGNTKIGSDSAGRIIVSYHKFDEKGYTQIYNARLEQGEWIIYQTSDWAYRWEFQGGGSINLEIHLGPVTQSRQGLTQAYHHPRHGSGIWMLDEKTLKPVGTLAKRELPPQIRTVESTTPGMIVRTQDDTGTSLPAGVRYLLKWETLERNRDRPRPGPPPPPTMLRLYAIPSP